MKRVLFAAAAAVVAMAAMPAAAATVNLNLSGTTVDQDKFDNTMQAGLSAAIAVGQVNDDSHVAADVTNAVNVASVTKDLDADSLLLAVNGDLTSVSQDIYDDTTQLGASIAGSGSVTGDSSLMASVANVANAASVSVNISGD